MPNVVSIDQIKESKLREQQSAALMLAQTIVSALCTCVALAISMTFIGFSCAQTAASFGIVAIVPIEKLAPQSIVLLACFTPLLVHAGLQNRLGRLICIASAAFITAGALVFTFTQSYSM